MSVMSETPIEYNIGAEIAESIEREDEPRLKRAILVAMRMFLEGKLDKDGIEGLAAYYIDLPMELGRKHGFEFADERLEHVFIELSALSVVDDTRARLNVERYIRFLEGREYEHLE